LSTTELMPISVTSVELPPPVVRLVISVVICRIFSRSSNRVSMARESASVPAEVRLLTGSITITLGPKWSISRFIMARCISRPNSDGREA
jgi:hypothetical protein